MPPKIGLAAQLAKQAAQAAREEVIAAEALTTPVKTQTSWKVTDLPQSFQLDASIMQAAKRVAGHYRQVLASEGLAVALEPTNPSPPSKRSKTAAPVASAPQSPANLQATLREQLTGRLVKSYTPSGILTLFATQQQQSGVVVDGQV